MKKRLNIPAEPFLSSREMRVKTPYDLIFRTEYDKKTSARVALFTARKKKLTWVNIHWGKEVERM